MDLRGKMYTKQATLKFFMNTKVGWPSP